MENKEYRSLVLASPWEDDYATREAYKAFRTNLMFCGSDKKVIALGRIDVDNIKQVKDYGFGGAAVLGGIWDKFDTCCNREYACLIEHFKKLKKLAD